MPYIPAIRDYKPFYIQANGDATAWDTTDYGLVAQTQPFPCNFEVKEPYKNTWFDEHGDEEYIGGTMYLKGFEYTVKFFVKTLSTVGSSPIEKLNTQIDSFMGKLLQGEFKVWDSWQEKGFQSVRFVKDNVESREINEDYAWMILAVTFKVNDPSTAVSFNSTNNTITTPTQEAT